MGLFDLMLLYTSSRAIDPDNGDRGCFQRERDSPPLFFFRFGRPSIPCTPILQPFILDISPYNIIERPSTDPQPDVPKTMPGSALGIPSFCPLQPPLDEQDVDLADDQGISIHLQMAGHLARRPGVFFGVSLFTRDRSQGVRGRMRASP